MPNKIHITMFGQFSISYRDKRLCENEYRGSKMISLLEYLISQRGREITQNELIDLCNFTSVTRQKYRIGVPKPGTYRVVFSSALPEFGGKGESTVGSVRAKKKPMHGYEYSIELDIEGLSCMYIKNTSRKKDK